MPLLECPGCGQTLDLEAGSGALITCPICGTRFNSRRKAPELPAVVEIPEMMEVERPGYQQPPTIVQNFVTYGQPPGQHARAERWSGLAIAGFVISLACGYLAPLSLIFSWVALNAMSRDRRLRGRGLAVAGLVLSLVSLAFWAVIIVLMVREHQNPVSFNREAMEMLMGQ